MNARLFDPEWREAWAGLPAGERPHWMEDAPALQPNEAPPVLGSTDLLVQGVTVRMNAQTLLSRVDITLRRGEVAAVLGPNGAGKSTLLSVLAGLRQPNKGVVSLGGRALPDIPAEELAVERAVLPQDTAVAFDFSVRDVVGLGRYPHRLRPCADEAAVVSAAMALTAVSHLAHRTVNSLSGGERARAQLARVLAQIWHPLPDGRPRWLLLDEPTAALDLRHQHETLATVRRWAREQGVGVLAVLHDPNLALRYADQVCILDGGRVQAHGAPHQTLTPELLQQVWRVRAQPVFDASGCTQLLIAPSLRGS